MPLASFVTFSFWETERRSFDPLFLHITLQRIARGIIIGCWSAGPLAMGAWLTPRKTLFSTYITTPILVILKVKPYVRDHGDLPENFDPSRPAFQGNSRSLTRISRLASY